MAKYTTVGPFAFKQKKGSKSVKTLKPVTTKSESRRAFAQVDTATDRRVARSARIRRKKQAEKERQQAAVRAYFGLPRRGYGSRANPIQDLLSGKRRLTTASERSQTVDTKKQYAETPKGFAVVESQKVRPYGTTTRDEVGGELRRQQKESRKYDERGKVLADKKKKLTKISNDQITGQLSGKIPIATATPLGVTRARTALTAVQKELNTRGKNQRKTEAEGMLAVLDNLSRPYYGVNSAAKAGIKGKNPASAAWKGVKLDDKTESWDVLEAAGVKNKTLKYGAGIPLAFASDPLSYVSLATAPVSGGASLAALSPKAAKIASLTNKAAKGGRSATRAQKKLDKILKGVQRGPITEAQAVKQATAKRGVKVSVGARVPGTQKFVGARTSGKTSAAVRNKFSHPNSKGPRTDAKDAWVQHMAPTGKIGSLTREESEAIVEGAAKKNAAITTGGTTRKITQQGIDAAIRKQLGIGGIQRTFRPRKTKKKVRAESARLAEKYDAGEDIGAIGKYVEQNLAEARQREHAAGLPTAQFQPAAMDRGNAFETAAKLAQRKADIDKAAISPAKSGKADKPVQRRMVDTERGEKGHSLSANARSLRQSARLHQELADVLGNVPHHKQTPKHLREIAKNGRIDTDVRKSLNHLADELDGRIAKAPKRYLPRYWKSEINKKAAKAEKKIRKHEPASKVTTSAKSPKMEFNEMRVIRDALGRTDETPGDPRQFVRDISGVVAKRNQDSIEAIASKELNDAVVKTGSKAKAGDKSSAVPTGYSVYRYQNGRLTRLVDEAVPQDTSIEHYILKDDVKNRADELTGGADKKGVPAGKFFDRATGRWKGSVTVAWPGYYLRNLISDTLLAREAGTDVKSAVDSLRVNRAVRKRDAIIRKGKHITEGKDPEAKLKKLSIEIDGKTYTGKELEDLATKHAAVTTGQHGSEVSQLVGAEGFSATNRAARVNIRRENLPRRATFIADLKRGNAPDKAGAFARKEHYDYGTRTEFQKQVRRVIPFFAWWDLNTRKQFRMVVQRPGKINEIYHVLNGASSAAGFEGGYREYLADLPAGKQRGLPIPIVVGHNPDGTPKIKDLQFGNVLSDLRTPLTSRPTKWMDELLSRGNPIITKPVELGTNHSGFFRGPIQPDYSQWAKAPKQLATETQIDRKTGKPVPVYSKKTDYALRSLGPWAGFALGQATKGEDGPFKKSDLDTLLGLTGVNPSTHDPNAAKLDKLYSQKSELEKRQKGLSRIVGGTPRKKSLTKRINKLNNEIAAVEKDMGYAIPLNAQGGRKAKPKAYNPFEKFDKAFETQNKAFERFEKFGAGSAAPKPKPKKPSVKAQVSKIDNLDKSQKDIVAAIVSIGKKRNVPQKHIVAALETGRVESNYANSANMTDHDSQGWRQERASLYKDPTNLTASINRFYDETKQHDRGQSAGELAADVQRPAAQYRGRYAQHEGEAKAILARVRGAKPSKADAPSTKNALKSAEQLAKKHGLRVTSGYRSPAHNASVGGVQNSYHTRGSKNNPGAVDLVGSNKAMAKAAADAKKKGYSVLIHNAGSGLHLHIQNDQGALSGSSGGGGGSTYSAPSGGGYSGGSGNIAVSQGAASGGAKKSKKISDTKDGMSDSERVLALLEYLSTKDKKYATKRLVQKNAIGEFSTV